MNYNGDPAFGGKLLSNYLPGNVARAQNIRVYGDEIPLPTEEFCIERALKFHEDHWPVACAWKRLGWKMFERGLTK